MGVVSALCHICGAPTVATCRICGNPACPNHMEPGGMCHLCMRRSRRGGERDIVRRPRG